MEIQLLVVMIGLTGLHHTTQAHDLYSPLMHSKVGFDLAPEPFRNDEGRGQPGLLVSGGSPTTLL